MKQAHVSEHTQQQYETSNSNDNEKRQQRMIIDIALPFLQAASSSVDVSGSICLFGLPTTVGVLKLPVWSCVQAWPVCCVCVVSCLPQQKLKFKQSKRANQQQQQQPSMIANFAASVTAGVAASCWSFTNSTSRRRLSLSLSSFLQLCLLPTNTDIHTHTHAHTHTLTFYARLLLWLLLFRRLHTHFYAMLCSFALLQRAPALSLSLLLSL